MSWRTTLILVLAAVAVAVVAYVNPFKKGGEAKNSPPWFYQVSMDDIEVIEVQHEDQRVKFVKTDQGTWAFEDPAGIPPSHKRWGGMTLLLSGPQTRRDLTATKLTIDDPAQYGLDDPKTIVDVGLTAGRSIQFRLGDKTTDGNHNYGQILGFPQLFLIANSWGDVLARLATEPPIPKWFIKRDPESIAELNIYLSSPVLEDAPRLQFEQKDGVWTVKDYTSDVGRMPVDAERWAEVLPLLSGPPDVSVAEPIVEDMDYSPWGITDESGAIEIRFNGVTDRGTRFIDGVLLTLGSKTPDGRWYYGRSEEASVRQPVLLLDAAWTETLVGLFDDIPYGEPPESQTSASGG